MFIDQVVQGDLYGELREAHTQCVLQGGCSACGTAAAYPLRENAFAEAQNAYHDTTINFEEIASSHKCQICKGNHADVLKLWSGQTIAISSKHNIVASFNTICTFARHAQSGQCGLQRLAVVRRSTMTAKSVTPAVFYTPQGYPATRKCIVHIMRLSCRV